MKYTAINIQGNIITSDILEKIRIEDIRYQKPIDFGINPTSSIREEISLAWSLATSHWKAFQQKRESLRDTDTGTTETRRMWLIPLLQLLGYDISVANAEIINGKSYAISHRASNLNGLPIHIVGVNQELDTRPKTGGTRLSPHALGQEYLNNHEHLYAFVSNGKYLRLLRDSTLLSRLSYVEFDLHRMMNESLYAEFALLYRLLHATRLPQKNQEATDCILEFYHVEALASGSRIRDRLSTAVKVSIKILANGLLNHSRNIELRQMVLDEEISPKDFYLYNLRTIYRILFLLVIEDRKLIYTEKMDTELHQKREIYYNYYSLQRLTYLAENLIYIDPKKTDLWSSLLTTFSLFEYKENGQKLGIAPLGSGLFHPNSLGKLREQSLDNETLLGVLRYLVSFENENKQRVRVNYADLDVEEFGSVYEGLLEYEPKFEVSLGVPIFTFVEGYERSISGSHYTPEELVKPLIDHSLQYQIEEKLKDADPEKGLLSLTVCDVACGSGHILLSAARRIGFELAKVRSGEDQPTPSLMRIAVRDVINNCIYGVDLNPLAVELCKVALWLEAHQPGEPLNFLDHHIKCGNAIVGLAHFEELKNGIATEAFKTLADDDKEIAAAFRKANAEQRKTKGQLSIYNLETIESSIKDIKQDYAKFLVLPEHTPEQIEAKTKAYKSLSSGRKWFRVKQLADLQIAQFFIPKTLENREKLTTEKKYQNYLNTGAQIQDRGASMAMAAEKRFFHWFLEFPQVFGNGGFDCVLGNPPFLGDRKLKEAYGEQFLEWIRFNFTNGATIDLVGYFFLRINDIIRTNGFQSLISTNTITQGKAREESLEKIVIRGNTINNAVKGMKWPGLATVEISLCTIYKGNWEKKRYLNNKEVINITSYFDDQINIGAPFKLKENEGKSYQGTLVLGAGFILNQSERNIILNHDSKYDMVISPFLNGDDLNNNIYQAPSRFAINFSNWEESKARKYSKAFEIIEKKVKPVRWKEAKDEVYPYWQFWRPRKELYQKISKISSYFLTALTGKHLAFTKFEDKNIVISHAVGVILFDSYYYFSILQSSIHDLWAWKNCSSMGISLRYTPSNGFQTFPFPNKRNIDGANLEEIGADYYRLRKNIMFSYKLGLTETYNQFHNQKLVGNVNSLDTKVFQKKYGKESWNLFNHMEINNTGKISYEELVIQIFRLRDKHKRMDEAVLEAYGWTDIQLHHDFYEIDYLPEHDNVRYTLHPDARKEVLKRLLELNHKRFKNEAKLGLHKKKDVDAYFKQKGKEIPSEVFKHLSNKKSTTTNKINKVSEPGAHYKLDFED